MRSVCIFCGSRPGSRPDYTEAARETGAALGARGVRLVFGGGRVGLMGIVADAAMEAGGEAVGVMPHGLLAREVGHDGLTELVRVETMHERKAEMADRADAFLALPGGIGTLEELMEVWTWAYLGIHRKPVGLLNVAGYYDGLLAFIERAEADGFLNHVHRDLLVVRDTPEALLDALAEHEPPELLRWMADAER